MDRRLALVTGGSAGIGAAFAKIYASHGYDVALTARRADRLERLAEEIRLGHGVETLTFAADLADPDAPRCVHAARIFRCPSFCAVPSWNIQPPGCSPLSTMSPLTRAGSTGAGRRSCWRRGKGVW